MSARPTELPKKTKADQEGELALAALLRGRALLDAGDPLQALEWLERAQRYVPDDPSPKLSRAAALLAAGRPGEAASLFVEVAEAVDLREAWLGAALAWLRLGRTAEAARAAGLCLSQHRWDGDATLLQAVADVARLPGWCALGADERLTVRVRAEAGPVRIIDAAGRALRAGIVKPGVAMLRVLAADGTNLLGSPLRVGRIRRVEGVVEVRDGGLTGWAWYPGDATRDPVLLVSDGSRRLRVAAKDQSLSTKQALTRPRGFVVPASLCARFAGPVTVSAADGTPLAGSPLDPGADARQAKTVARMVAAAWPLRPPFPKTPTPLLPVPASLAGQPAAAPPAPLRPVAVVVPVYGGREETLACLRAVRLTVPDGTEIVVIDDASLEPALAQTLRRLAESGRIRLRRLARNGGFPAAANAGLRLAAALPGRPDLVLLNSDTLPAPGWLERLRAAVHAAPDIGTASPLSNDATILSYPDAGGANPVPGGAALALLGRLAARANPGTSVTVPTAVGFCMYIRRECLRATGLFRADLFAQGYGEENDFCLRGRHLGWRHVAVPGAYVAHVGGRSFGTAREALTARNLDVLERLHPGYRAMIEAWIARDPLLVARRRLDRLRAAPRLRGTTAALLVTHASGGGVERCVEARRALWRAQGVLPIVLRSMRDRSGTVAGREYLPGRCRVEIDEADDLPNLIYTLPEEIAALAALLRTAGPRAMEVHHLLGHDHSVLSLAETFGIGCDMHVHDYAAFCPRITLTGVTDRYCGEPDLAGCEACIADAGRAIQEEITVPALVDRSAAELAAAARVIVPSRDTALRLRRHFPAVHPQVEPHEADADLPPPPAHEIPRRVCVIGAIGMAKGYDVLLACVRDARTRDLKLRFRVVGHTIDDARLLDAGPVTITGPYEPDEAQTLVRAQRASLAFIPSVWPETWCLALGEAFRAGLPAVVFDLGAQAERVRATGYGRLLPLGLPAPAINNALLSFPRLQVRET